MASRSSDTAEFTAKSLDEALAAAAQSLGVPAAKLDYEVVHDSTRTLFGLVRKGEVTVRVTIPGSAKPRPTVAEVVDRMLAGDRPVASARRDWNEEEDEDWDEEEANEDEDMEAEELTGPTSAPARPQQAARAPRREAQPGEIESVATEVVATLLDKMGILAAVEVTEAAGQPAEGDAESSPLVLNLVGDDLGMLIGRRGETLRDLQFITRLIVSRRMGSWPNLVLDVEGYKSRRTTALRSLAKRMADQVRRTHQPVILEPMPANERRIVHLTLRDDPDVYTESTGEDEARKVQILPKRGR